MNSLSLGLLCLHWSCMFHASLNSLSTSDALLSCGLSCGGDLSIASSVILKSLRAMSGFGILHWHLSLSNWGQNSAWCPLLLGTYIFMMLSFLVSTHFRVIPRAHPGSSVCSLRSNRVISMLFSMKATPAELVGFSGPWELYMVSLLSKHSWISHRCSSSKCVS